MLADALGQRYHVAAAHPDVAVDFVREAGRRRAGVEAGTPAFHAPLEPK